MGGHLKTAGPVPKIRLVWRNRFVIQKTQTFMQAGLIVWSMEWVSRHLGLQMFCLQLKKYE